MRRILNFGFLFLMIPLIHGCSNPSKQTAKKIVGSGIISGALIPEGQSSTSFNAFIETESGKCSGSLITPTVVLTAAHCVVNAYSETTFVSFGSEIANSLSVKDIYPHPDYYSETSESPKNVNNDIALIELSEPVGAPYTPVEIFSGTLASGQAIPLEVYGYGPYNSSDVTDLLDFLAMCPLLTFGWKTMKPNSRARPS
jgi:secreted trypsin-like serine protease